MKIYHYRNTVVYTGKPACVLNVFDMWTTLAAKEKKSGSVLPECVTRNYEYLQDISFSQLSSNQPAVFYTSKYSPNEEVLITIAKKYNINYYHEYYNSELLSYGVHIWSAGQLFEFEIEEDDYLSYDLNPSGRFVFENHEYPDRLDIFKIIVSRKIGKTKPSFLSETFL